MDGQRITCASHNEANFLETVEDTVELAIDCKLFSFITKTSLFKYTENFTAKKNSIFSFNRVATHF